MPAPAPTDLEDSLNQLGVDTTITARRGLVGGELGQDYSPLGTRYVAARPSELLLVGMSPGAVGGPEIAWFEDAAESAASGAQVRLATVADAPWVTEQVDPIYVHRTRRDFVAADLDADGRQEVVAVRVQGGELLLTTWEDTVDVPDPQQAPTRAEYTLDAVFGVQQVAIAAGDFDGDTFDELLIGYTTVNGATLALYDRDGQAPFMKVPGSERTLLPTSGTTDLSLVLACGNIDQDAGFEYAYVLNEESEGLTASVATFGICDDVSASWEMLDQGAIAGEGQTAIVASVAMGDVDGDTLDEIVFGGLYGPPTGCDPSRYIAVAYEDRVHGLGKLGARLLPTAWSECQSVGFECGFVHTLLLDIDGDNRQEVVINQHVLEADVDEGLVFRAKLDNNDNAITVPQDAFFDDQTTPAFTRSSSTMAVGDVNADGLTDISIFRQTIDGVRVFTPRQEPGGTNALGQLISLQEGTPIETNLGNSAGEWANPILVSVDSDDDGITMVRTEAEHLLTFSQPVVVAVLAAPPSIAGIQQNYSACTTTFGNTQSSSEETERTLKVEASVSVGVNVEGGFITQSQAELKGTLTASGTAAEGESYSTFQTVEYTTGPQEDTVIFTTIPLDRYIYRIVRHPDSVLENAEIIVDLPRRPIILQVERSYYNSRVLGNAPRIDQQVLAHEIGDINSYPTRGERNQILTMSPGIQSSLISVGQGTGSVGVTLGIENAQSMLMAYEVGTKIELEVVAATVLTGFSIGGSFGASLRTTYGQETTYSGSVGSIAGSDFDTNSYDFGLFSYYYLDPESLQRFQVINYWVE